ncbi:MAG: hypothetical protein ACPLRN_03925 [Microgenomates group bacterium]
MFKKNKFKTYVFLFLSFFLIVFLIKEIKTSVFLKNQDRVNIVFYSSQPKFISLSKNDLNYLVGFSSKNEILVPGGYQDYKIGALGKLVYLEKKPDLFKKTFSGALMIFVDLYFYPKKVEIYYQEKNELTFPKISDIFLQNSNANFLDRILLAFKIFNLKKNNFRIVDLQNQSLDQKDLIKKLQGYFYKESYRQSQETVQILYSKSYLTAEFISNIISGEGIRVVDISFQDKEKINKCQVITKQKTPTSLAIANYFSCFLKIGETDISDIILKLGTLEREWAVN